MTGRNEHGCWMMMMVLHLAGVFFCHVGIAGIDRRWDDGAEKGTYSGGWKSMACCHWRKTARLRFFLFVFFSGSIAADHGILGRRHGMDRRINTKLFSTCFSPSAVLVKGCLDVVEDVGTLPFL